MSQTRTRVLPRSAQSTASNERMFQISKRERKSQQQNDLDLDDTPTPKGKRGKTKTEHSAETRCDQYGSTVRWAATPNQKTRERIQRALPGSAHRMFLIETKQLSTVGSEGGPSQEFAVLGATGNVYTVVINRHPSCNCPDAQKGNLCKHVLFVYLRVLKLKSDNPLVWQKALLTHEVQEVLSTASVADQSVLACARVRQKYEELHSKDGKSASTSQRPIEGDCPICYEPLEEGTEAVVFCHTCGNNIHEQCFQNWSRTKKHSHDQVTCVYCRTPWQAEVFEGGQASQGGGNANFVNLGSYSQEAPPSLEDLYGDRAVWIDASHGAISRRAAARLWRASQ